MVVGMVVEFADSAAVAVVLPDFVESYWSAGYMQWHILVLQAVGSSPVLEADFLHPAVLAEYPLTEVHIPTLAGSHVSHSHCIVHEATQQHAQLFL